MAAPLLAAGMLLLWRFGRNDPRDWSPVPGAVLRSQQDYMAGRTTPQRHA